MEEPGEGRSEERGGEENESGPRASDAERDWFCAVLERHFADGRLSREELDERLEKALGARSLGELYALVSDLPIPPSVELDRGTHRRGGWRSRRRRA